MKERLYHIYERPSMYRSTCAGGRSSVRFGRRISTLSSGGRARTALFCVPTLLHIFDTPIDRPDAVVVPLDQSKINKGAKMPRTRMSFAIIASALLLASCVARHASFTEPMVLTIREGLTTEQIRDRFGAPDRTRATTCGSQTPDPWPCLVWEYDMGDYKTNSFTFSMSSDPPWLNYWRIDHMHRAASRQ
jgi:hypothetical protein